MVSKIRKTLDGVARGTSDANVKFRDLCALLKHLGFAERVRGSHHIFSRDGVAEILNLQPRGNLAKPYQVKQVRGVIVGYNLTGDEEPQGPANIRIAQHPQDQPDVDDDPEADAAKGTANGD